jgi:beta-lactamase superfamily II metal-dependent hydrolase
MTITKYEIDLLNVKAADACLIHFYDENENDHIVLVDAGNYSDGESIIDFIKTRYKKNKIDLAICSHCDRDHFGGFIYLLEQMRDNTKDKIDIEEFWVHDPADHIALGKVKHITKTETETLEVRARSVFDLGDKNMLDILDGLCDRIRWFEPFSDSGTYSKTFAFDSHIEVIGPSISYYEKLVPDFRNDLQRKDYATLESEDSSTSLKAGKVYSKTLDEAGDDPSSHNQSSVIFIFKPDNGKKYLFMGDGGRDAIDNIKYEQDIKSIKNVHWLKVPHHGSKYNLDNDTVSHINPKSAFISTEKIGHYLSQAVVNALKQCGGRVYSTHKHGSIWHQVNTDDRNDYSSATSL